MKNTDKKKLLKDLLDDMKEMELGLNLLFQPIQGSIREDLICSIRKKLALMRMRVLSELAPILKKVA